MNEKAMSGKSKAVAIRDEVLNTLSMRIKALEKNGEIHFPPDYSPQNALRSAWLIIQTVKDKDGKAALDICTKASVYNSLFDMLITGLNPAKKQGYCIVYGSQLVFQRSYFGSEALAKRVDPSIQEIVAEPVYEGDEFEFEIRNGKKVISKHKQTIESMNSGKVKAAYCLVINGNGEVKKTEIMTFEEIKKAWAKSKMYPVNKDGTIKVGSTHDEFMGEMVRKTVINRTCKPIWNSSDDKYLKIAAMRSEVVAAETEAEEEIEKKANQEFIDVEPSGGPVNKSGVEDPETTPPPDANTQWRDEWINLKGPGYSTFIHKNFRRIEENGARWPDLYREMKEKWAKLYPTAAWPLVEKAEEKPITQSQSDPDKDPDDPNRVFLTCPSEIDNHRPRKAIEVCEKCKHKMNCDPYVDWAMEHPEEAIPGGGSQPVLGF